MDSLSWFILPLLGGLILYFIINAAVKAPGQSLNRRFVQLGQLKGKSKTEIISAVGPPNAVSQIADRELLQWMATGYHIALIFKDDECLGVSHEFRA